MDPQEGGPPEDLDNFPEGGVGPPEEDLVDIEARGEEQGQLVEMAYKAPWDQ